MDIRESFSRLKKKFKRPGSKRKPNRTGTDSDGGRDNPVGSLSRPVSHIVAGGGHNREDNESDADVRQIGLTNQPPIPSVQGSVSAPGGDNGRGGEGGVDGQEVNQRYSHLHPDIEVVAGNGSGQNGNGATGEKVGQIDPSPSVPPFLCVGKPDGMRTL